MRACSELGIKPTAFNKQFSDLNIILYIHYTWISYWKYFLAEVQTVLVEKEACVWYVSLSDSMDNKLPYMYLLLLVLKSPSMCFL